MEMSEVMAAMRGNHAQIETVLDEILHLPENQRYKHGKQEHVEKTMLDLSKAIRGIVRNVMQISPSSTPLIPLIMQAWMAFVYYIDTLVAGNELLVQEAITVYKEEFERKKSQMNLRVKEIIIHAERMRRGYEANIKQLNQSLDRLRKDNSHLDGVLRDREE